jgi:hypothetical protein
MRQDVTLLLVDVSDSDFLEIHFTKLLQRAASVKSCTREGVIELEDSVDLWFPISRKEDLFKAIEFILRKNLLAVNVVELKELRETKAAPGRTCKDIKVIFNTVD